MKVYKVVRRGRDGELYSVFAFGRAQTRYKVDEYVEAPEWLKERGYNLLAFSRRSYARKWFRGLVRAQLADRMRLEIWEAEAEGVESPGERRKGEFGALEMGIIMPDGSAWPPGSVMCRRIKLIQRVG